MSEGTIDNLRHLQKAPICDNLFLQISWLLFFNQLLHPIFSFLFVQEILYFVSVSELSELTPFRSCSVSKNTYHEDDNINQ